MSPRHTFPTASSPRFHVSRKLSRARAAAWVISLFAVALLGGEPLKGTQPWLVGDIVICGFGSNGSGQCKVYSPSGTVKDTVTVLGNPKQATGGAAWSSEFDLYFVDARNKQVLRASRVPNHTVSAVFTTTGTPGPLVVNSAGTLYVGLSDALGIVKYDGSPSTIATTAVVRSMDLADDHKTMWFTSSDAGLRRVDVTNPTQTSSVTGAGTASAVRVLPLRSPYDGSAGLLVAGGGNIRALRVNANAACVARTYDVNPATDEGWRTLALAANDSHFLATTAAGDVYQFAIGDTGACPASPDAETGSPLFSTGSTSVSDTSVKGGHQLNVRPLTFANGSTDKKRAVFGNPNAAASGPFPPHDLGIMFRAEEGGAPGNVTLAASALWAKHNVVSCVATDATDIDCRTEIFEQSDDPPSPRCIPYVSGQQDDCVVYRLEDEPQAVSDADKFVFIDFLEPAAYLHPECTGDETRGNPRMLQDPNPVPNGNGTYPFERDITTGVIRTADTDPIVGGGKGGSDYAAFDRCSGGDVGATGDVVANILQPTKGSTKTLGSSIPFRAEVVNTLTGADVTTAVTDPDDCVPNVPCYNMSLYIRVQGAGAAVQDLLHLDTPGNSPTFFQLVQVKQGKTTRFFYEANWNSSEAAFKGTFTACVTSFDQNKFAPGLFAPTCVTGNLK